MMLTRKFTRREKVLLVLLVLVALAGLYVLAVHNPVKSSLASLESQKEELELQTQVANARLAQYTSMKKELDEIFAMPKDQLTVMPEYDNIETLMVQFNSIFTGLEPNLRFPNVTFKDNIAARPIQFTFAARSYQDARSILTRLTRTGQRSLLDGLSVTPADASAVKALQDLEEAQGIQTAPVQPAARPQAPVAGEAEVDTGHGIAYRPVTVSGTLTFYELAPGMGKEG